MRPSPKTDALVAVDAALRPTGFVRRGHVWLQDRGGGVSGWLGFGVTGRVELTPLVGVCFRRYDDVCRALGVGFPPAPVVSAPLGFLMGDKPVWRWAFEAGGDHDAAAAALVSAFLAHGKPYIDTCAEWDALSRELVAKPGSLLDFERARKLAIVHVINGDVVKASALLAEERERVAASGDAYARAYRAFVRRFELAFAG
ncbi:hypothetical protein SAMN05216188_102163 [Lentzea xinjiangensis]|uniref:Uncharacterized protein n=1 Tax=Lentzea xinjiangensis TaxID=402600 RepID=A0A1H9DK58_9PSEU|nr:hypothetical protein [Lentzea xinjiangensis]SEQ13108.1 hypothetical protein SAMN05216188_102163 [Lentzea xinjiangensis]